ncbi:LytR/AlgR family response regulator transcription factor [Pedobacter nutrimenti]|jgi:DNA-binding LytR/AlgR family response regulator|uniref:LytTR family two component transcriptional regulator n=1 Tax=Pedobacter nutrimenti TaxID=1241337 RepID=A0A318U762_9SPHI|nr:response regulator transcription factor [Pedobacter nutrimenti]PYF69460.1 LytTR family two component transcriptional regulator [Pedobacter nutrimenti]
MKCIIVDDEPIAREGMKLLVDLVYDLELQGVFSNVKDAGRFLQHHETDLILLDIQMPEMDGLQFARHLSGHVHVIFTTAFEEYALESYELEVVDYLVKPIREERFIKAIKRVRALQKTTQLDKTSGLKTEISNDFMLVKAERKFHKILYRDVLYIQGLKDYVIIHLKGQKFITALNIKSIYNQLPGVIFKRVGRSYILNMDHISSFDNNSVFIEDVEFSIGDSYKDSFFDQYLKGKMLNRRH